MSKNFEQSLKSLSTLVEKMEKGNMSLEELLKEYEKGVGLISNCQNLLKTAEQKIEMYSKTTDSLVCFDSKDGEAE